MSAAERRWSALLPVLLGLAATLPLLMYGPSCGHDFDFHLQSWLAVRGAWHAGLLVPHWVPGANYGAGEPRFIFYPPLTWLLGAALNFVLPWAWVPAAFTFMCFAGAAASMQQLANRFCAPVPAAAAATLYTLSPYLLFTGYERSAYGELLAAAWMPLLLGALLEQRLHVVRIALLLAALWYTNAPAAVMGCYLVAAAVLWRVCSSASDRQRNSVQGTAALALGCCLSADYLLPAWYEQRFVAIQRAIGPGMRVDDSFLFEHTGEIFHDQVLRTASWIGVATFAAAAVAYAALLLRRRRRAREYGLLGFPTALLGVCFVLQFPASAWLWHHLPELAFLQFPWRLLLPASAAAALVCGLALPQSGRHARAVLSIAVIVYAAGMVAWTAQTRYQPCDDEDNVRAQLALLPPAPASAAGGFEGTDEYAAAGTDNGEIQQELPAIRLLGSSQADEGDDSGPGDDAANPPWKRYAQVPGSIRILHWAPEELAARVTPERPAFAVLRLERYPGWQVLLNGHACGAACVPRDDGLLTIAVAAHRPSMITAHYRTTRDVVAGRILSCVAALLLLVWRRIGGYARLRRPAAAQL